MDELIKTGDGILSQINNPLPLGAKADVFMPYEVGDYSIYVHENLDGLYQIGIYGDGYKCYRSKEIITSSEGSIVYFDEKITPDIQAGYIYRGWKQRYFFGHKPINDSLAELFHARKITFDEYLNYYIKLF
jgi:hypothetical protein